MPQANFGDYALAQNGLPSVGLRASLIYHVMVYEVTKMRPPQLPRGRTKTKSRYLTM
jgi:hypothetical protein